MTCAEASELLDAFVDAELPPAMLLGVARHAAGCPRCDESMRGLTALRDAVERCTRADVDGLDLSRVWPGVERAAARIDARRTRTRRLRAVPVWVVGLAAAASAVLWFRTPGPDPTPIARARRDQAVIERIDSGGGRFELRREPKYGTTLIMVSAAEGNR
jgi:anti-sigma factor RsiW